MNIECGIITCNNRPTLLRTIDSLKKASPEALSNIQVLYDMGSNNFEAHLNCWKRLVSYRADYLVLFQDDIIVGKNWYKALQNIIEDRHGVMMLSLFTTRKDIKGANKICRLPKFLMEQGLCMNWLIVKAYIDYCDKELYKKTLWEGDWKHSDCVLAEFFKHEMIPVLVTSPSFVQHVGEVSAMGHPWKVGGRPRISQYFLGEEFDLLSLYPTAKNSPKSV